MMRRALLATAAACACLISTRASGAGLDTYPVVTPAPADKLCGYANAAGHATQCSTVSSLAGALTQNTTFPAPTPTAGSIVLTPGSSPTSTPTNGSIWCTSVGCFAVVNGTPMPLGTVIPSTGAGGSTGQVQFNSSGVLAGIPGFTWSGSALTLPSGTALPSGVSLTLPTLVANSALMGASGQTLIASPTCGGVSGASWLVGTDIASYCSHIASGGTDNLSFGTITLNSLTSGFGNLAFGSEVLHLLTTGSNNACFGFEACHNMTTGGNNDAIGFDALAGEQTGGNNVAMGQGALQTQNGGSSNVGIGPAAGPVVSTGANETLLGAGAGVTVTTGNKNIMIGVNSGFGIVTGHGNVWIGGQGTTLVDQNGSVTLADGDGNIHLQYLAANGFENFTKPVEVPGLASSQGLSGAGFAIINAGSGASAACATGHVCDSISGEVTVTTGTGTISAGQVLTLAFNLTRTNKPNCDVSAFKGTANVDTDGGVETTNTLVVSDKTALASSSTYTLKYVCGGI